MRSTDTSARHLRAVPEAAPGYRGDIRNAVVLRARLAGWDVVGHRWLRMTRAGVEVEVWFTDISSRVVKARCIDVDGSVDDVDIVHNRDRRTSLDEIVAEWIDAPTRPAARTPLAARTRRPGSVVSAGHSGEFEAIGRSWATRPAPEVDPRRDRTHPSGWIRTDTGAIGPHRHF